MLSEYCSLNSRAVISFVYKCEACVNLSVLTGILSLKVNILKKRKKKRYRTVHGTVLVLVCTPEEPSSSEVGKPAEGILPRYSIGHKCKKILDGSIFIIDNFRKNRLSSIFSL